VKPADVAAGIAPALRPYYLAVRDAAPPVTRDRPLSDDIRAVNAGMRRKP
jgi:histidine ammonia-lyase